MNFSIYLKDEIAMKLQAIAEKERVSRNNLISEAVERLIEERESSSWGEEVMNWEGCPEFELPSHDDLLPPGEDIF
ncbi:MAG: ribbon-helix-helix domain-containing protein [Xenococcaceae cyanobacterium MO_188.B29]|nr:ribbon-helix-helix domain-containing protein [Xenococcaceae cyanobacterium MO_188.B29]